MIHITTCSTAVVAVDCLTCDFSGEIREYETKTVGLKNDSLIHKCPECGCVMGNLLEV